MSHHLAGDGGALGRLAAPTRNRYFYGKLLDSHHLDLEQLYVRRQRSLLSRLGLGAGVLVGLEVVASSDGTQVRVGRGVAVDPIGRELVVSEWTAPIDPRQPTDPDGRPEGERIEAAGQVTLYQGYDEVSAEPVPMLAAVGGSGPTAEAGATRERYRLWVRRGLPPRRPELVSPGQGGQIFPADLPDGFDRRRTANQVLAVPVGEPPPPADRHALGVALATVRIGSDGTIAEVDPHTYRPVVYSNAVLFDLLLRLAARVDALGGAVLSLGLVDGDAQVAAPGEAVGAPLVVEVRRGGEPVADESVTFDVDQGDGRIGATAGTLGTSVSATSDGGGQADLPVWELGTTEPQTVVARVGNPDVPPVTFQAFFTPLELEIVAGDGQTASAGAQVDDALIVRVSRGSAPLGDLRVTFRVTAGGGRIGLTMEDLGPEQVVTTRPRDGLASLDIWELGQSGVQTVTATIDGSAVPPVEFSATVGA